MNMVVSTFPHCFWRHCPKKYISKAVFYTKKKLVSFFLRTTNTLLTQRRAIVWNMCIALPKFTTSIIFDNRLLLLGHQSGTIDKRNLLMMNYVFCPNLWIFYAQLKILINVDFECVVWCLNIVFRYRHTFLCIFSFHELSLLWGVDRKYTYQVQTISQSSGWLKRCEIFCLRTKISCIRLEFNKTFIDETTIITKQFMITNLMLVHLHSTYAEYNGHIGFSSIAAQWKIFCACDIRLKAASCTIDYAMESSYFFVSINFLKGKKKLNVTKNLAIVYAIIQPIYK